jgi:hypothetical protein
VQGTRVGNDADCVIVINYFWSEANNASDVDMSVNVSLPGRSHNQSLPAIPLPANDAITTITVNITS